ncbi:MAG TPA: DUF2269 family protein [Actinomycetota bacterium]|nr:DUF2269 family protein [Actinomycetota bacterium]
MSLYELLKTLHVLGAAAWAGAVIVSQFLGFLAARSGQTDRMVAFIEDEAWLGPHYFAPISGVMLITGIAMVVQSGWQFEDTWVALGLVIFFVTVFLGMFLLGPKSERLAAAIRDRGLDDAGVQADTQKLMRLTRLDLALLVLVIAIMVIKPGA